MYWLTRDEKGTAILMAFLPQDEVWEGGMPGRWLEKQSLSTFAKSAGDEARPFPASKANTVGDLLRVAQLAKAEVVVLSLTTRAYFSQNWWRPLVAVLKKTGAMLSLPMGPSLPPSQSLPLAYWTPSDLEEMDGVVKDERREVEGGFLPLIGALSSECLTRVDPMCALKDTLIQVARQGRVMAAGGLVHYFADFYSSSREDMLPLISSVPRRVLDVGCAKGEFGRLLKERWDCEVWGIEMVEESAKEASKVLDRVEVMNVEEASPEWKGLFDLVVLGDILEHLQDPWGFLRRLREWLARDGRVITSIPNVGFYPIVRAMLQGRFDYVPVGLLCIEHLRFFTRESLREMFEEAGFQVLRLEPQPAQLPASYQEELERLAGVIPSLDEECLKSPGYYVVATPQE